MNKFRCWSEELHDFINATDGVYCTSVKTDANLEELFKWSSAESFVSGYYNPLYEGDIVEWVRDYEPNLVGILRKGLKRWFIYKNERYDLDRMDFSCTHFNKITDIHTNKNWKEELAVMQQEGERGYELRGKK